MNDALITLRIWPTQVALRPTYGFHLAVNGFQVVNDQRLSLAEAQTLRGLTQQYATLFGSTTGMTAALGAQERAIGVALFNLWLGCHWQQIEALRPPGQHRTLLIESDEPAILDLPWALLRPPGQDFLCNDAAFALRYRSSAEADQPAPPRAVSAAPLRVLLLVSAPDVADPRPALREEAALLRSVALAHASITTNIAELGTLAVLQQRLRAVQPHLLHLVGQTRLGRRCASCRSLAQPYEQRCRSCGAALTAAPQPFFAFEDARGGWDWQSGAALREPLAACSDLQCVLISAPQQATPPAISAVTALSRALASPQLPLVVGWPCSLTSPGAVRFAGRLYQQIAAGATVDAALAHAHNACRPTSAARRVLSWPAPVVYAATSRTELVTPGMRDEQQAAADQPLRPLPGATMGAASCFVGRRRELHQLTPALLQGSTQSLLLTGDHGSGKSVLATALARLLAAQGFVPVPVPSTFHAPLTVARLLFSCAAALRRHDPQAVRSLADGHRTLSDRLEQLLELLERGRIVLLLDRFDVNLDPLTGRIRDPWLAAVCQALLTRPASRRRVLITSCVVPSDFEALPPQTLIHQLDPFSEEAFVRFLLHDPIVARRYERGEYTPALLSAVYQRLGAVPQYIEQLRAAIRRWGADVLQPISAADSSSPPAASAIDPLLTLLNARLSAEAQQRLQQAAVYHVPVRLDAQPAARSGPRGAEHAQSWQQLGLATPLGAELWTIAEALRPWLLAPTRCPLSRRQQAHAAAGDRLSHDLSGPQARRLGVPQLDGWLEARAQYIAATAFDHAREVTDRISHAFVRWGLYDEVDDLQRHLARADRQRSPV